MEEGRRKRRGGEEEGMRRRRGGEEEGRGDVEGRRRGGEGKEEEGRRREGGGRGGEGRNRVITVFPQHMHKNCSFLNRRGNLLYCIISFPITLSLGTYHTLINPHSTPVTTLKSQTHCFIHLQSLLGIT